MESIANIRHMRKVAKVTALEHAVKVEGSLDGWQKVVIGNLRGQDGVDGRIKGLSSHALSRLRHAIASTAHVEDYRTYGLCLTIPWGDKGGGPGSPSQEDGAEIWARWVKNLGRLLDRWHIGIIYRVELQSRRAVHWHLMAFLPNSIDNSALDAAYVKALSRCKVADGVAALPHALTKYKRPMIDTAGSDCSESHFKLLAILRLSWVDALNTWHEGAISGRALTRLRREDAPEPPALVKSWDYCFNAICLNGVKSGVAYLASHTSKHKQEQLGYVGKQWGYLGKKWLRQPEPVALIPTGKKGLSHAVRIRAFRLLRKWIRRNRFASDWRSVRPSRRFYGDSEVFGGLVVRNTRTLYLFATPPAVVSLAWDCAVLCDL